MLKIKNITPSAESLCQGNELKCLDDSCPSTFTNQGNLHLHMLKRHNINIGEDHSLALRFFCPEANCKYNRTLSKEMKFFQNKNLLRQHYHKMHATKTLKCTKKCEKMFSTENLRKIHEKNCGQEFRCLECGWTYDSKEALLTHCRRKNHPTIVTKPEVKNNTTEMVFVNPTEPIKMIPLIQKRKFVKIAPKITTSSVQTTPPMKLKTSKTTQTAVAASAIIKRPKIDQSKTKSNKKFLDTWNKRITESEPIPTTVRKSKAKNIDLFDSESSNVMTNDSMSQTDKNLNKINFVEDDSLNCFGVDLCHIETQTEFDSIFKENNIAATASSSSSSSSSEDPMMLYTHMHTQTCDDILTELGLIDIQTQTNWPSSDVQDMFVSTETQTSFTSNFLSANTSTYTQTICENQSFPDVTAENSCGSNSNSQSIQTQTFSSCLSGMDLN